MRTDCGHGEFVFSSSSVIFEKAILSIIAQTNYYLGKITNSSGESEINLWLYVSRDIRLRIG